ncbi:MAG: hypothetical protein HC842_06000 [Cytophagales bacterium]|nr:hypothetical protein [Cytophagales bacterium]
MKRRNFIKNISLGTTAALVGSAALAQGEADFFTYQYPQPSKIADMLNEEGHLGLRIALSGPGRAKRQTQIKIQVKGAQVDRVKSYLLEPEDRLKGSTTIQAHHAGNSDADIWVYWLKGASENTVISIKGEHKSSFMLSQLLNQPEVVVTTNEVALRISPLLYHEVGAIDPASVGISAQGDSFSFVALADPQGGDPAALPEPRTRMKIHNAFIEDTVEMINALNISPAFAICIGDVCDGWGHERDLAQMNQYLGKIKSPLLYTIGNHETKLGSDWGPGYNMAPLANYLAAQKALNGLEKCSIHLTLGPGTLSFGLTRFVQAIGKRIRTISIGWNAIWSGTKTAPRSSFSTSPSTPSVLIP